MSDRQERIRDVWFDLIDAHPNKSLLAEQMGVDRKTLYRWADGTPLPAYAVVAYRDATGDLDGYNRLLGHMERQLETVPRPKKQKCPSVDEAGFTLRQAVSVLERAVHDARADGVITRDEMNSIDSLISAVARATETNRSALAVVAEVGDAA